MHVPTVYSSPPSGGPSGFSGDARTLTDLIMFARRGRLLQTDVVLMVHEAQIWRPHRTRNRVRIHRRLRLLLRLSFFARRHVRRMINGGPRYDDLLRQPFGVGEWAEFLRFALDNSYIVPALDRA